MWVSQEPFRPQTAPARSRTRVLVIEPPVPDEFDFANLAERDDLEDREDAAGYYDKDKGGEPPLDYWTDFDWEQF